ncbi:hypothetical protein ACFLXC_04690 [Chloroflexota bacterium]
MEDMGRRKLVDKGIFPQEAGLMPLQLSGMTPAQAMQNRLAVYLLGGYKGQTAFVDLDKLVNEPLVKVEQQHILGILNGAHEGRDLITVNIALGAAVGLYHGELTVPAGAVYYLNAVHMFLEDEGVATNLLGNWRVTIWPDPAAVPNPAGQPFHAAGVACPAAGGDIDQYDEFGPWTTLLAIQNKTPLLRLPAGTVVTFEVATAAAVTTAALACTLALHGFIGKRLLA